ncbi:MAG: hypothetical protein JNK05_05825 [Myxococcales bacterium]|nr:hypothetical protein [Myxococcales bacterium]
MLSLCALGACSREAPRVSPESRSTAEGAGQRSQPRLIEQPSPVSRPSPVPPQVPQVSQAPTACGEAVPETDRAIALGAQPTTTTRDGRTEHTYREHAVFLAVTGNAPAPRASADTSSLRVELLGATTRRRGQPLGLRAEVRNGTSRGATVIRSNDGSFEHMREPFVDLYVQNTADQRVYRYTSVGGRCGMVNTLNQSDLVSVAAGATSPGPFSQWVSPLAEAKIPVAGRFRVWLVYRQCDWQRAQGMGGAPVVTKPGDLFEGQLASNAIEIDVR